MTDQRAFSALSWNDDGFAILQAKCAVFCIEAELGLAEEKVQEWAAWVNREGLSACEALVKDEPGPLCFGDGPTLADLCLVPQLGNARRFGVDVSAYPRLLEAEAVAKALPAFASAAPERQGDAE